MHFKYPLGLLGVCSLAKERKVKNMWGWGPELFPMNLTLV